MSAYRPLENLIKLTVNESCILKTLRIMSRTIALVFQESQLERRQWLSHPVSYKHQTTPSVASKRDIPPTTITKGNIAWNEVDLAFDLGWFIKLPIFHVKHLGGGGSYNNMYDWIKIWYFMGNLYNDVDFVDIKILWKH